MAHQSPKFFIEDATVKIIDAEGFDYAQTLFDTNKNMTHNRKIAKYIVVLSLVSAVLTYFANPIFIALFIPFSIVAMVMWIIFFTLSMEHQKNYEQKVAELNLIKHDYQKEIYELEKIALCQQSEMQTIREKKKFDFQNHQTSHYLKS